MYSENIIVQNKTGLHARPAATFVQTAAKFQSNVTIEKDSKKANAKSMLAVLALGVSKDAEIRITAEGEDENHAVKTLKELVESKFGEE
ncbi:MAG: crh [Bacillota bacterium]|jgi:phosphotransferase system HPr (HPr) family protein|nr:crh [Bacillota bacterium]